MKSPWVSVVIGVIAALPIVSFVPELLTRHGEPLRLFWATYVTTVLPVTLAGFLLASAGLILALRLFARKCQPVAAIFGTTLGVINSAYWGFLLLFSLVFPGGD